MPRPKSSTPALLLTHVNSFICVSFKAFIRFSGIPQRPNPPTNNVAPSGMSLMASAGLVNICINFDVDDKSVVAYRHE